MPLQNRLIKYYRCFFSFLFILIFFYLIEYQKHDPVSHNEAIFYSTICHDDLQKIFLQAINESKQSILLIIYSLNDTKIIQALNKQADNGINIKIMYDPSTPLFGFRKLSSKIDSKGIKISGLMHQKILVIDKEKVFLGSANMTYESLKLHDNLLIGLINHSLAEAIINKQPFFVFTNGQQMMEYWSFPEKGKEGVKKLIELIDNAKNSIKIAMFTWTHAQLAEAVIRAYQRGIRVEIILDQGQSKGVGKKICATLVDSGLDVRLSSGLGLLHHKFTWIDNKVLCVGSANWTVGAFSRNWDCFLIFQELTITQNKKLEQLWKKTKALSHIEYYSEAA